MKLIVGLGNKGNEYSNTRHNIGFMVIDKYCKLKNITAFKEKMDGIYFETVINKEKVMFLKPQKYINLSGEVINKYMNYFNIDIDDILVINDDLDLNLGNYKLKKSGGSAGHNGLKNIENHLHTKDYKRIKIGISNDKSKDTRDYVLGKITKEESLLIDKCIDEIINIIDDYFILSFDNLMNKYNTK